MALKHLAELVVGRATKDFTPDLVIAGVGLGARHCVFNYEENTRVATIFPNEEDAEKFVVKVNGEVLKEPRTVVHGDRILVGNHHYYIYCDPGVNPDEMVDWTTAMKEANAEAM